MNCRLCGAQNISASMGGPDICSYCDCYPLAESKLRQENTKLKALPREGLAWTTIRGTIHRSSRQNLISVPELKELVSEIEGLRESIAGYEQMLAQAHTIPFNKRITITKFLDGRWGYYYTDVDEFLENSRAEAKSGNLVRFPTAIEAYKALKGEG